jgi:hypothetical protein
MSRQTPYALPRLEMQRISANRGYQLMPPVPRKWIPATTKTIRQRTVMAPPTRRPAGFPSADVSRASP